MIVVCKKGTTKLVKGLEYNLVGLDNADPTKTGSVKIEGLGWYTVNNFETTDGKPLPKIDIALKVSEREIISFDDLSKGDILICKTDSYKTLVKGGMYRIEELSSNTKQMTGWSGNLYTHTENYVKFEGITRKLMYNSWRFEKLPVGDAREMALEQVLYDTPDKVTKTDFRNKRKIEHIENKENVLMSILSKSILDENRHKLNITEWAVRQLGRKMDLEMDDYSDLMNMKLSDILKLIDNKE